MTVPGVPEIPVLPIESFPDGLEYTTSTEIADALHDALAGAGVELGEQDAYVLDILSRSQRAAWVVASWLVRASMGGGSTGGGS